jgi:transposase InsO family protein
LQALRDRVLSAEAYPERTDSDELLSALFSSATVQPVTSDRLDPTQLQQLQQLVNAYQDQISWSSDDIGCLHEKYKDFYMRIPTEPGARCKQKPYRLSLKEQEAFKRQLAVLLEQGIVRRASGPTDFLSPVLFVPKPRKPDELRMCVDFRRLNSVTKRDYHALPFIRDLQQSMKGCKYFTALDLTWGFWALPIVKCDQHKTAFTGPDGEVYVWTKAPMGLANSPASFQRLMEHVFQGIAGKTVYVDDITAFSKTWDEHLQTLRQIFDRLKDSGLKVKFSKCVWAAAECRVLGSIVSEAGIRPDPDKVSAVQQLPVPRTVADLRSFLGATGYFHEHIKDYAAKTAPLRALLKKNATFQWSEECQQAFERLKADLVSDACLRYPDLQRPFILTTDWSQVAVGAVLSQMQPIDYNDLNSGEREYVIAYASRGLTPAESRYAPTEGECLCLVWATKKFRPYLHGTKFLMRTDHAALKWLQSARFENSKLERWALRLQEFDFEVMYLPGAQNVVADHLSRHFPHFAPGAVTAVAGHLAFSTAGQVLDVVATGCSVCHPSAWCSAALQELWTSGDAESIAREPCVICGEAEGYAHMLICDICNRPSHLQCLNPPRSVVPDGPWYCHLCDGAYTNIEEFRREEDPILFARGADPYHYAHSQLLDAYVRLQEVGLLHYRNSLTSAQQYSVADASTWATDKAESVFTDATPKHVRRRVRNKAKSLRLHPTLVGWYLSKAQLRSGDQVWLAVPPVEYRWGLIGAFHDRLGHSGVNQTLAVMHQHYHWSGMKADIAAFVRQCHPCQVRRLELHHVAEVRLPRMSRPFQHVHIDLAGPFPLRQVSVPAGRGPHGRTKASLSTTVVGSAFICIVVDYFTKAAEFLFLPDKTSLSVAKAFHDGWLMRYGLPEWLTSDNGTEFQGAFRHQLERFGIEHVLTSSYHPQSNGAAERLVQSVKAMLFAKVSNAMHDWRSLLPTIRMEYMQRRHSVTGCSPNELVFATEVRLPPPIGALHWAAQAAAVTGTVPEPSAPLPQDTAQYLETRAERAQQLFQIVHDRILQAQRRNAARQTTRRAGRRTRGRALAVGDLAYLLTKKSELKTEVSGPFVVCDVSEWHVELRTSNAVQGQEVSQFKVHKDRVARCTSVTDVLEDLLKHAGMLPQALPEEQPN